MARMGVLAVPWVLMPPPPQISVRFKLGRRGRSQNQIEQEIRSRRLQILRNALAARKKGNRYAHPDAPAQDGAKGFGFVQTSEQ